MSSGNGIIENEETIEVEGFTPEEKFCGHCGWSNRWATKSRKLRKKCMDCEYIQYCDDICRDKDRDNHVLICQSMLRAKGKGKALDKLYYAAKDLLFDNKLTTLNDMIEKCAGLLNWAPEEHSGMTLIHCACQLNHFHALEMFLLKSYANPNARASLGETPLMTAAEGGVKECMALLLDPFNAKTDVNTQDSLGRTCLHTLACCNHRPTPGRLQCMEMLLGAGANVNHKDHMGATPLHAAIIAGDDESIEFLFQTKASVDVKENVRSRASLSIIELLIRMDADVNDIDKDGNTCLFLACKHDRTELIDLLIGAGADPNIPNKTGGTPLIEASLMNNKEIISKLINAGAEVNASDNVGNCALTSTRNGECQRLLIEAGAALG